MKKRKLNSRKLAWHSARRNWRSRNNREGRPCARGLRSITRRGVGNCRTLPGTCKKKATKHTNTTKKNNKRARELHADTEKALHSVTESGAASSSALSSLQDSLDTKCKVLEQRVEDYEKLAMDVLHQEGAEGPTSEQVEDTARKLRTSFSQLPRSS